MGVTRGGGLVTSQCCNCNAGIFSVLNYEDEPMDINVQTLHKSYADEFLKLKFT